MAGTKEIKRRIKSIRNTKKITKAMELVAASKMKRAVSSTLSSRPYAEYSWEVLTSIAKNIDEITHPLFVRRGAAETGRKKVLLVLITSNRGLCGAYNAQVIKKSLVLLRQEPAMDVITVGKKGDAAMRRLGRNVVASFTEFPENVSLAEVLPIAEIAMEEYKKGNYDEVAVAYTDFQSALVQKPNIKQILPISRLDLKELIENLQDNVAQKPEHLKEGKINYVVEGEMNALVGTLAEKLVRMQLYQMLLESAASEQSARMVAMRNATDASGEMIDDLTLSFNKARQAGITQEISEISAGMASVS
ncbi:MAG TPA: ATP synthase F1 subunit gamma [Candidatus Paceibacterota bacterium]|jgi:F-type H+-transporting ATPase subunit gamma|nr:ATP synthase F1 subunit gamma [Candidatus Paceibacterota bacterium]